MNPTNQNKNKGAPSKPVLPKGPNENIFKIWELVFDLYKTRSNLTEKRRNFLWLLQAALFYGYFIANIDNFYKTTINILGIIVSFGFAMILKRDKEYHIIHEENLRNIENNINQSKINSFKAFLLEKEVFHSNKRCFLNINLDDYSWRLNSVRTWENCIFPWLFIVFWFLILIYRLKSHAGFVQPTINC